MKLFDPTEALKTMPKKYADAWRGHFMENLTLTEMAQNFPRKWRGFGVSRQRMGQIVHDAGNRMQWQGRKKLIGGDYD